MKQTAEFKSTAGKRSGIEWVRGFFAVLARLAGAFILCFLVYSFLNETDAPSSPELTAVQPESGVYLSVSPESGTVCSILSDTDREGISARLRVDAADGVYLSEPFKDGLKIKAGVLTAVSLDPSALRYTLNGSRSFTAEELITMLPADAEATVVLTENGEVFLTGKAFCLLPFLTGGAYDS